MSKKLREPWRELYEKFTSPIDKFQFLCGLKELSWEDCQDAWFESQKIMPEVCDSYKELERKLELAEKCLQYFVDRVEGFHPHGQIRSQRTYTMFKQALAQIGEGGESK